MFCSSIEAQSWYEISSFCQKEQIKRDTEKLERSRRNYVKMVRSPEKHILQKQV